MSSPRVSSVVSITVTVSVGEQTFQWVVPPGHEVDDEMLLTLGAGTADDPAKVFADHALRSVELMNSRRPSSITDQA